MLELIHCLALALLIDLPHLHLHAPNRRKGGQGTVKRVHQAHQAGGVACVARTAAEQSRAEGQNCCAATHRCTKDTRIGTALRHVLLVCMGLIGEALEGNVLASTASPT